MEKKRETHRTITCTCISRGDVAAMWGSARWMSVVESEVEWRGEMERE